MRIGIYGGAFNPVHKGHIKLAREIKAKANLDKIIIMPSGISPHKGSDGLAESKHRLEMCRLAFKGDDYIVSDLEIKRQGKSYTVDTVRELKKQYGDHELFLIMGSDMLLCFHKWYCYEEILSYATICATTRQEDISCESLRQYSLDTLGKESLIIDFVPFECSSTKVREYISRGEGTDELLSREVADYIKINLLYDSPYPGYRQLLREKLDDYRLLHSINVAESAKVLAEKYGGDPQKAYFAGLMHDVMKNASGEEQLQIIKKGGIILSRAEKNNPKLWHAIAGECFLRTETDVSDGDILNAVRYHTTGRANMSPLEKIIYVADYISAERNYPDVGVMRELAFSQGLNEASLYSLRYTMRKLTETGGIIHTDSVDYYNELIINERSQEND